ncbi:zinc-dependent metalloprotease [Taibaiella soli]|uniref:Secretion system C-terminal sorting domain-containing protein n=1 Tax=Taibaiella soli TaxID=1649169 RepID=A0A2W2BUK6_9BACT|nr:zinc-dependent metalloprotease [Taibaiella soli]PZF71513.1 hypothetical protein DN068_17870 [Taibaiella soli]
MRRILLFILMLVSFQALHAQVIRPFQHIEAVTQARPADDHIKRYETYLLDAAVFESAKRIIPQASDLAALSASNAIIALPIANGQIVPFYIAEVHILSPESAQEHPEIKNYDIRSVEGNIKGRITYSPMGMSAVLLLPGERQYITPFSKTDALDHAVYALKDYEVPESLKVLCGVEGDTVIHAAQRTTNVTLGDCKLRTYRLAVAATGEYTNWAGSQANAIADITTTVANASLIYELQLAIKFTLTTNSSIVFTDSLTDPYPTASFPNTTILNANTTTLNSVIGTANYDIGFVLNYGWNGGLAYTPAICGSNKGGGAAGLNFNTLSSIMDNMMAHEIGHMFSAQHTMSTGTNAGVCSANVNLPTAYEPGGGSSIMAYSGSVCAGLYYQNYPDGYFHFNSEQLILTYAISQNTCGTQTTISNSSPVISVPAGAYTIPVSTPFTLKASGTDVNGDQLTYTFDQYDVAATYMTAPPSSTATSGPIFRSYPPSATPSRTLPPLSNILSGVANTWEVLPSVSRTVNFKVMTRDNASGGGCVAYENIVVTTNSSAGPFAVTSQNSATSYTANGSNTMTVTWNVANTTASPVSSPNVDILFSADNGQTFPYTLASATANNGTKTVLVPNVSTTIGRIKVQSSNNIFFDINKAFITINSPCAANGAIFSPTSTLIAPAGSLSLNQGLTASYGSPVNISGTITSSDPIANLAVGNGTATTCASYSNVFQYKTFSFQPTASGSYTFTRTTGSAALVFDLYQGSYTPSTPCNNYLVSNYIGGSSSASFTVSLTAGITYVMTVGTFTSGSPALPASFAIGVTPPAGGNIYSSTPDPGAGYNYTFVIVNSLGNIQGYSATGDMSNASLYPADNYTVYGLSVDNTVSQTTLDNYTGGPFSSLQAALLNGTICGNLSANSRTVQVMAPLGVTGISLSATRANDHTNLLWQSYNEHDMSNYLIERSADGRNFSPVGNTGAKNSSTAANYSFTDNAPESGANFYRIRGIDYAGANIWSNVREVLFNQQGITDAIVFPNPLNAGVATVKLTRDMGVLVCSVTNINGQLLQQFTTSGTEFNINLQSLAKGIYFFRISGESGERINLRLVR